MNELSEFEQLKFYCIIFWKILTVTSIYTMDYPDLTESNFMENFIGLIRVNKQQNWPILVLIQLPHNVICIAFLTT